MKFIATLAILIAT